jgi:putative hydrolase of the HAD superfamily
MVFAPHPPFDVVFFDLGYTLINFEGSFSQALSDSYHALAISLVRSGISLDPDAFSLKFENAISEYYRTREIDLIERPVEGYINQVLADLGYASQPDDIIQKALNEMYYVTESYWNLESDALPTLEELKARGFRLGLITNAANAPDSNRLIDKFDLRKYFEVVLISAEEKIRKPDVRIFRRAINLMQVLPDQAIMVGDTLKADIHGAQKAGIQGIWINRRADRPENEHAIKTIKPDAIISQLSELLQAIYSLNQ